MNIQGNKRYWQGRTVLVTGHEGFLGSWLTKTLVGLGANVIGVDKVKNRRVSVLNGLRSTFKGVKGNVANLSLIKRLIDEHRPQIIFHLAAEAIVGKGNKEPVKNFKSNIEGTWNILEAARGKKFIEAIIVASSDKAYGSHEQLPYRETTPLVGEHPYDVSKSCADLICRSYFITYNIPVCVTRCGNIYGPGDFNFSRIAPDAIRQTLSRKPFVIRSDGKFTRDYIYVEDVVNAYLILAQKVKSAHLEGEAFNFSCEQPMSVLDFFGYIDKACGGVGLKPKILNKATHEIRHQHLSAAKARKILGWKVQYNLEDGLEKTIQWYRQIGKGVR